MQEELQNGHVQTVDELIVYGVRAVREKFKTAQGMARRKPRKNLADFLLESPFHGSDLEIDRQKDYPREIDLS